MDDLIRGTWSFPACTIPTGSHPPSIGLRRANALGVGDRVVFLYLGIGASWQCPAETVAFFKQIKRRLHSAYLWILTPDKEIFKPLLADIAANDHRLEYCAHHELANRMQAADFGFLLRKQCSDQSGGIAG